MVDQGLISILENNFQLSELNSQLDTESEYFKYLQMKLAEKIKFFIRTDLDKLLQILYRIDLPQSDTDNAFDLGEIGAVSSDLAEKIIHRQLKKIQYAKEFYNKDK